MTLPSMLSNCCKEGNQKQRGNVGPVIASMQKIQISLDTKANCFLMSADRQQKIFVRLWYVRKGFSF